MDEHATVVVVGGGATGTAVARDLAMRDVDVALFERGPLCGGTSGHMHHLLHSGARYADSDPASAEACAAENRVLRDVAGHCVAETGGLVARHPDDPDGYLETRRAACADAGVPVERLSGREARDFEPALAGAVDAALRVPDAVVDPFGLVAATAADAVANGARVATESRITDVRVEAGEAVGVTVDGDRDVAADHVVNAAGPWAGRVAALADVEVSMRPAKGAMAAVDVPTLSTVINRCRPRSEGDIAVPVGDATVLGTTDAEVADPEAYPREDAEVDLLRSELAAVVPAVADAELLEAYWGVRPLHAPGEDDDGDPTAVTRDHVLLDHAARDDRPGLHTIVGGKLTTARAMGETVADHLCDRLGVAARCRTADAALPEPAAAAERLAGGGVEVAEPGPGRR